MVPSSGGIMQCLWCFNFSSRTKMVFKFKLSLTYDVVNFEQPGHVSYIPRLLYVYLPDQKDNDTRDQVHTGVNFA